MITSLVEAALVVLALASAEFPLGDDAPYRCSELQLPCAVPVSR
jgi:hypothetical protein